MKSKITIALVFCVLIALAVFFVFIPPRQSSFHFAFFLYDESDTFIAEMWRTIALSMPEDIYYEVFNAGNSQSIQNRQIVEQIERDIDVFIINAVDRLAGNTIVERLSRESIPIIFFNREPLEDAMLNHENVFYVGAAADIMGIQQADIAAEFFEGAQTINIVILKGEHGHQDAEKRTENSINRLRELGFNVNILATRSASWRRQDAYDVMSSMYSQFGENIDLVFSNNDDMALGAIDFLLSAGIFYKGMSLYEQPFIIISVDGTPIGLEAVYNGLIFATVHNNIERQTSAILTLADYLVNNRNIENFPYEITNGHFIYIRGDIITRENVIDFIGFIQ